MRVKRWSLSPGPVGAGLRPGPGGSETRPYRRQTGLVLGATVVMLTLPSPGSADASWIQPGEERVKAQLGWFLPAFDTNVRVNAKDREGGDEKADLEDDLGLDDEDQTYYGNLSWRLAPRHRLSVGYMKLGRDARFTAEDDIELGDGQIIEAGATGKTDFGLDVYPIAYSYSMLKRSRAELALVVGVHWHSADLEVDATAWLEDEEARGQVSAKADLPAPLLGVSYEHWLSERWSAEVGVHYFGLDLGEWAGELFSARVGTEYWVSNHFGVGAAVNAFGFNLDADQDDWSGGLEYEYWGPQLYVTGRF